MILVDIAKELKKEYGYEHIPTNDLVGVLRDGFDAIGKSLKKEGVDSSFQIPKFGSFKIKVKKARIGRNPQTGEKINIPAKVSLSFKTSHIFKTELAAMPLPKENKKKDKKKSTKKKK